jgi:hypothetical protein
VLDCFSLLSAAQNGKLTGKTLYIVLVGSVAYAFGKWEKAYRVLDLVGKLVLLVQNGNTRNNACDGAADDQVLVVSVRHGDVFALW